MCNQDSFRNCMDTTCFTEKTGICLCHSNLRKSAEKMIKLSDASKEIEKIVSNELGQVADGESAEITSRLKRIKRLLSSQEDEAIPSFDDGILGEEMMPAEIYGTNYGKTKLTSGWESCKSFVSSCEGDNKLFLKNYLQKSQQSCAKLEKHLDSETTKIRNSLETARKLFENTKNRKKTADATNSTNCEGEITACFRKECKGIYFTECYEEALCGESNCKKNLKKVLETKKENCSKKLKKCGSNESKVWKKFLQERIDYISEFQNK
ncbi:MAG: hypothetical protein B6I23_03185 [Rickettsiaceae bacterium 4572_127]|nr:MAG: hypothetical protein B6I23_03185 [Rickettsiaceae bacterium 4572_127]